MPSMSLWGCRSSVTEAALAYIPFRFHNGQTISLSVILGAATLWYTWHPSQVISATPALAAQLKKESLRTALFTGSIYWASGFAAVLFPNTSGLDPEFGGPGYPQLPIFFAFMAAGIAGWVLESISG